MKKTIELIGFGVCKYLGGIMGINASRIRLYFIYASFVTLGSPIIIYLFTAFWLNINKYFREDNSLA